MLKPEYSPYKFAHVQRTLKPGEKKIIHLHLVPTNRCNQNCCFCAYRQDGYQSTELFNTRDQLTREQLIGALRAFKAQGGRAVQFTGGGEPLLHPDICEAFEETKRLGLSFSLVTNGVLFDEEKRKAAEGASWVRISLDAAKPATYSAARKVKEEQFSLALCNIKSFVENKMNTTVGVGFVVNELNYKEIFRSAIIAKGIGADNFRISAVFNPKGVEYFDNFFDKAKVLARQAETLTDTNFTVFNLFNDRIGDMFTGKQTRGYCFLKDYASYLGADNNLYVCCVKSYTKSGMIGQVGDSFPAIPEDFDPRVKCQHPCMFNEKNDFIEYVQAESQPHAEFI